MPLRKGTFSFKELSKSETFLGLPGVVSDSLPDKYGRKVLNEYFSKKGIPANGIPLFAKLLYMGKRGMGALEYEPEESYAMDNESEVDIAELWLRSRKVLEGKVADSADQIFRYGGTAGGARAKAVILYDPVFKTFKSPFSENPDSHEHWLIKFDAADIENAKLVAPQPWERLEYVYNMMAKEAGFNVPDFDKIQENGRFHFLVKRFDRNRSEKIHMVTFGGIKHFDFLNQREYSYEDLIQTTSILTSDKNQTQEVLARAVFNVATQNMDDHVKNHSFLMDNNGTWSLSPVYDLVFTTASHSWFSESQQMSVNGKYLNIKRQDFRDIARNWGVENPDEIIDRVLSACSVESFSKKAHEVELPSLFPVIYEEVRRSMADKQRGLNKDRDILVVGDVSETVSSLMIDESKTKTSQDQHQDELINQRAVCKTPGCGTELRGARRKAYGICSKCEPKI